MEQISDRSQRARRAQALIVALFSGACVFASFVPQRERAILASSEAPGAFIASAQPITGGAFTPGARGASVLPTIGATRRFATAGGAPIIRTSGMSTSPEEQGVVEPQTREFAFNEAQTPSGSQTLSDAGGSSSTGGQSETGLSPFGPSTSASSSGPATGGSSGGPVTGTSTTTTGDPTTTTSTGDPTTTTTSTGGTPCDGQASGGTAGCNPTDPPVIPTVPEPETWAMMLLGFGGIGYAMRRRLMRRAKVAASN